MKNIILLNVLILISLYSFGQTRLWGVTQTSEIMDTGYFYSLDANGSDFRIEQSFTCSSEGFGGGALYLDSGNIIYGINSGGGSYGKGRIFKYNITTGTLTTEADFSEKNIMGNYIQMTKAGNGKFYGLAEWGGDYYNGFLYEFDPVNKTITKKVDFHDVINGKNPTHPMVLGHNGKLYGTTKTGGSYGFGVLFKYDPINDSLVVLVDFNSTTGRYPEGNIALVGNDKIYGQCHSGPGIYRGYIFEYNYLQHQYTKKYTFGYANGTPGTPITGFSKMGPDTLIAWNALNGNPTSFSIIKYHPSTNTMTFRPEIYYYSMNPERMQVTPEDEHYLYYNIFDNYGSYENAILRYSLENDSLQRIAVGYTTHSSWPFGVPVEHNGQLYINMSHGGYLAHRGLLERLDTASGTATASYHYFVNGATKPNGQLLQASNGKIYNLFQTEGLYFRGAIMEYDPDNQLSRYISIPDSAATFPMGNLLERQGKLYGVCNFNFIGGGFSLFSYDLQSDSIEWVYHTSMQEAGDSKGKIIMGSNGNIWGTFKASGQYGKGGIFEYDFTLDTLIVRHYLDVGSPIGALSEVQPSIYYGLSYDGGLGTNAYGYVYNYNALTDSFQCVHNFKKPGDAMNPVSMIKTHNNQLYGLAMSSIISGHPPVIFKIDISTDSVYVVKTLGSNLNFDAAFCESPNGKLYFPLRAGHILEYDPQNNLLDTSYNFLGGIYFKSLDMLNRIQLPMAIHNVAGESCPSVSVYPNPYQNIIHIHSNEMMLQVEVYDLSGKRLRNKNTRLKDLSMDIEDLPIGVYLLKISTKTKTETLKIIRL